MGSPSVILEDKSAGSKVFAADDRDPERRSVVARYAWMVVVAFLLRLAYILVFHTYRFPPGNNHFSFGFEAGSIAGAIARGEGFSSPFGSPTGLTTWIAPIYPYFCAAIFKIFGLFSNASGLVILSFNSICAALTCIPIVKIADRTIGRKPAMWSGWCWAVVPIFFQWPTTWVWEISLSALLLSIAFLWALELGKTTAPKSWMGFGIFWGLTVLTNPALLTFLPFSLMWPSYELLRKRPLWMTQARLVSLSILTLMVVISPWMIRNSLIYHKLTFVRGNAGFELHMGNFHFSNGMGWGGYHPTGNPRELEKVKRMGEPAYVAENQRAALKFIRENKREFLQLTLKRFVDFWDGTSIDYTPPDARWFINRLKPPWPRYIYCALSLLALWGMLLALGSRIHGAWLFASLIFYPTAYYVTFTNTRYRHAMEPEMLILAVYFLHTAAISVRKRMAGRELGA